MVEFEHLIDATRLRALFEQGTGRGMRVAVLDTGVEADHPKLRRPDGTRAVVESWEIVRDGGLVCRKTAGEDLVGHGTACAGIIHRYAPDADLYSVRVIGKNAVGTGDQFIRGLRWAIDHGMHVVNLSLGTTQPRLELELWRLANEAYFHGTLLVAAANNFRHLSYPANSASLIAVDNQPFDGKPDLFFHVHRFQPPPELAARGIYVEAPSRGGQMQLWTGTSFACPHVAAVIVRLRSVIPNLTAYEAKTALWALRENRE